VVFLLAFPLRSTLSRLVLLLAAPLIALISNTLRIALLAIFTGMGPGAGQALFHFFHDDAGSLTFAGVAVFVYGLLYMHLLERELQPLPNGDQEEG
jgi:exosortase/archaeosortase family protein